MVVAISDKTSAELASPQMLILPMSWDDWFLRTMIHECGRREIVLAGRVDPHKFEPWKIASADDVKAWRKAHPVTQEAEAKQFRAGDKRNNYGVTGRSHYRRPDAKEDHV